MQTCASQSDAVTVQTTRTLKSALDGFGFEESVQNIETKTISSQTCNTVTSSEGFQFNDDNCHVLCGQQKMLAVNGYKVAKCNYDLLKRKSHNRAVCMQDFAILFPGTVQLLCRDRTF
jgi:hypothetical protein